MIETTSVLLASGLSLGTATVGDGSPTVVFLPGPTDSWVSYRPVLEAMPSSARAIAVSQRGHGDSDKPDTGYRITDFAADAVELLDALGLERTVLVGHSGSCLTVRRVAIDHPERVAGVVLEASPLTLRGNPELTDFVHSVVYEIRDPIDPDLARAFVADTSSDDLPASVVDELVAELVKVPSRVWREVFADLLVYDDIDDLATITAPARLVWGDGDTIVDRVAQDELARRLGAAVLTIYPGAGHTPRWENPRRFAEEVASFSQQVLA